MRFSIRSAAVVCAGLAAAAVALSPAGSNAQMGGPAYPPPPGPPPVVAPAAPMSPQASEIAACLCLHRDMDGLNANLSARQQAYSEVQSELASIDAQLQRERGSMDVNNPQSVAQFRQMLAQRDTLFRRSTGPLADDISGATARYNAAVSQYNARCANQPRDPELVAQISSSLACPAPQ